MPFLIPLVVVTVRVAVVFVAATSSDVHPEGLEGVLEDVGDPAVGPCLH